MGFQVHPVGASRFEHLFEKNDEELAAQGALAYISIFE